MFRGASSTMLMAKACKAQLPSVTDGTTSREFVANSASSSGGQGRPQFVATVRRAFAQYAVSKNDMPHQYNSPWRISVLDLSLVTSAPVKLEFRLGLQSDSERELYAPGHQLQAR